MTKDRCELCDDKIEIDATMPTAVGIFRADLCMKHGLGIQDNMPGVSTILKRRAKERNIELPTDGETLAKLLYEK